ncbi:hypothetical protein KIPB_008077, partial [Kipferlia bialata]|eukprot:g8077.t1
MCMPGSPRKGRLEEQVALPLSSTMDLLHFVARTWDNRGHPYLSHTHAAMTASLLLYSSNDSNGTYGVDTAQSYLTEMATWRRTKGGLRHTFYKHNMLPMMQSVLALIQISQTLGVKVHPTLLSVDDSERVRERGDTRREDPTSIRADTLFILPDTHSHHDVETRIISRVMLGLAKQGMHSASLALDMSTRLAAISAVNRVQHEREVERICGSRMRHGQRERKDTIIRTTLGDIEAWDIETHASVADYLLTKVSAVSKGGKIITSSIGVSVPREDVTGVMGEARAKAYWADRRRHQRQVQTDKMTRGGYLLWKNISPGPLRDSLISLSMSFKHLLPSAQGYLDGDVQWRQGVLDDNKRQEEWERERERERAAVRKRLTKREHLELKAEEREKERERRLRSGCDPFSAPVLPLTVRLRASMYKCFNAHESARYVCQRAATHMYPHIPPDFIQECPEQCQFK